MVGWWNDSATPEIKQHVMEYLNVTGTPEDVDVAWLFIQVWSMGVWLPRRRLIAGRRQLMLQNASDV